MTADLLFSISNPLALVGWLFLVFLPRWRWTTQLITSVLIPILLGVIYVGLIVTNFGSSEGGFGSLEQVKLLFANDYLVVAGWVHYLVFDLFVGSWILRDSQRYTIHHLMVIPCLLCTFMFGPLGLLLYLGLRSMLRRTILITDERLSHAEGIVSA